MSRLREGVLGADLDLGSAHVEEVPRRGLRVSSRVRALRVVAALIFAGGAALLLVPLASASGEMLIVQLLLAAFFVPPLLLAAALFGLTRIEMLLDFHAGRLVVHARIGRWSAERVHPIERGAGVTLRETWKTRKGGGDCEYRVSLSGVPVAFITLNDYGAAARFAAAVRERSGGVLHDEVRERADGTLAPGAGIPAAVALVGRERSRSVATDQGQM